MNKDAKHNEQKSVLFKMSVIGESNVGKSCLMNKYTKDEYKMEHSVTIGVEFTSKQLQIDGNQVKLQIWDTAGQETFRSIVSSFYRNAQAIFLIYDITKKESFDKLDVWYKEALQYCGQNITYVLIGNKLDREDERQFMQDSQISLFYETSAKSGENVVKAFEEVAKEIHDKYDSSQMIYYQDSVVKLLDINQSENQPSHCLRPCSC